MLPGTNIQAAWLCLMACDLPFFSWSHSRGFQWGSGVEIGLAPWYGLSLVALHQHFYWPGLCGNLEHCPVRKNNPLSWGLLYSSRREQFCSTRITLYVCGLSQASFICFYLKFGRNVVSS